MIRPSKVKKTQSSRRHAFSSFRERIDSIKIEPNLNLSTRVHDYVEVSHFLTTLNHWKEVNLSGDFTEFLDEVESYCQTLPQLLYHQNKIFDSLYNHIEKNDVNSIQPLLELISQFIHDLGPDFMPFYIKFLNLLTNLATSINPNDLQNSRNTSNVLEWCFNSLAFSFKYLSRSLVVDLVPTFETLLPVLSLTKKTYISRFAAEALSFLIRKLKTEGLVNIIDYSFNKQIDLIFSNESYRDSLVVLYGEAIMSTSGSFHSKSSIILSKLVENSLDLNKSVDDKFSVQGKFISVICDVLLNILNHGTPESCEKFYKLILNFLNELMTKEDSRNNDPVVFLSISQILITISFAESGRRIKSWLPVLSTIKDLFGKLQDSTIFSEEAKEKEATILMDSVVYLLVLTIRNGNIDDITKYHKTFFDSLLSLDGGAHFLPFTESNLSISEPKLLSFGISSYVQTYINKLASKNLNENSKDLKQLAFFLNRLSKKKSTIVDSIVIPKELQDHLLTQLQNFEVIKSENDLFEIYWRLSILKYNQKPNHEKQAFFTTLLNQISDESFQYDSSFSHDLTSIIIDFLSQSLKVKKNDKLAHQLFDIIISNKDTFSKFQKSSVFIASIENFLSINKNVLLDSISEVKEDLIQSIGKNMSLPNHQIRENSINLIILIYNISEEKDISNILNQIQIIEQIPLSISTGRDLELRIRNLASSFKNESSPNEIEKKLISRFMIGLLTNKFQPCWKGVYSSLPLISPICSNYLWELFFEFLTFEYGNQNEVYYGDINQLGDFAADGILLEWQPKNYRIHDNFKAIDNNYFVKYEHLNESIIEFAQSLRGDNVYEEMLRSRILECLLIVPSVAESHSKDLVPLVLGKNKDSELEDDTSVGDSSWSLKDRSSLINLFSKFNNLKKVYDTDAFYDYIMKLLSHKQVSVQKVALDVLINWKNPTINKYKDNLRNLLDETIFRDEISKLIIQDSDSNIEDEDFSVVVPVILRILFGRAQGASKIGNKTGKKFAVVSVLPNFPEEYIIQFLEIGSQRIGYEYYFNDSDRLERLTSTDLRRISGFVNLLDEVYNSLGHKFPNVLSSTIKPLVYSLIASQHILSNQSETSEGTEENGIMIKVAKSIRQSGLKCLDNLFKLLGSSFEWDEHVDLIYSGIIQDRLEKFADENIQLPSSLLKIIACWIDFDNLNQFLYIDDYAPIHAIMGLLSNSHVKESVLFVVLDFCVKFLTKSNVQDDRHFVAAAILVETLLARLPEIIENTSDRETNSKAIHILLLIVEGNYIDNDSTRSSLLSALTSALEKPSSQIIPKDKVNVLLSLSALIDGYDCSFEDLSGLYQSVSKSFRFVSDRSIRQTLVTVMKSIGEKFLDYQQVSELLDDLNAFSTKRMEEPDFEKRLRGFKLINEELYTTFTPTQWSPIINCALFFIQDELEFAIRTNAAYVMRRFIDCFSSKSSIEEAQEYLQIFRSSILSSLRTGIRHSNEDIKNEYIGVLAHAVRNSKYLTDLEGLKSLTAEDEEEDFFFNITHIQLHRRQAAIRSVCEERNKLTGGNISHYLIPIIESYAVLKDEKFRNISNEAVLSISILASCVTWNQYKALLKRYISNMKNGKDEDLKLKVNMVVAVSKSLHTSLQSKRNGSTEDVIKDLPEDQNECDSFITNDISPSILKILNVRNDDTIVARAPLSEALTSLIICISEDKLESALPGTLTSTCQVMRSRSEELRDAVRKSLGKIVNILGPKYFKFILKELKSALSRGSQIHVLSYTMHNLMVAISPSLSHGDLDDSTQVIVDIIMEDIFGAAGQEKDAEGYTSKMKEVKFKKSFDSGELLSSNINLLNFSILVEPLKLLLSETISHKTETKLDELLRRYSLGLNHNSASSTKDILIVCYELHQLSSSEDDKAKQRALRRKENINKQNEDHFLVQLNAKPSRIQSNSKLYNFTLQKFAFDLLRVSISRHDNLMTVPYLEGFIPLLQNSFETENEGVIIASLKILMLIIKLPFNEQGDEVFQDCAKKCLDIINDSPSTNSEICQSSLKFLATLIRHKPSVTIQDSAISYVLERVQPDLEEPNKQGLAFNFLKAVVSQHIMIPEVYDVMDRVARIMVVNHSKEIRDMSRSVYFQFLMEYDQGRGRLEKQFKFLVNNLGYVTQAGRQSVMELIHLIVVKSGSELLKRLASSFFVALANVVVSDDAARCREMATSLISSIFLKLGASEMTNIETYINAWLNQSSNSLLKRCGLSIYKIYIGEFSYGSNPRLDEIAIKNIITILKRASKGGDDQDIAWEDVYVALNVFSTVCSKLKEKIFDEEYEEVWHPLIDVLLFPHSWVRLIASRLIGILLTNVDNLSFELSDYEIQTIGYRLLHQLGAPSISKDLGAQIVKNLVVIVMRWEKNKTKYIHKNEEQEISEESSKYEYAIDFLIARICFIMRQDRNSKESHVSKLSAIQFAAMLVQVINADELKKAAEKLLLGLYNFTELDASRSPEDSELVELATECMQILENSMGVTEYTTVYAKVKLIVNSRRQDRRTKRAHMAINAPDVAARRKMKKHERFREKRKHEKDENGYYRAKKKRTL